MTEPEENKKLKSIFKKHSLKIFSEPLNSKNIKEIKNTEIIVSRTTFLDLKLNKDVLINFPNLKMISTMSTGFDYIDLDFCKQKNIIVCNVPRYGEKSVAEHTFALILTIAKKIPESVYNFKHRDFEQKDSEGIDLNGKTLGVIGTGRIGLNVIKIANGFDMKVICCDIFKNEKMQKELGFDYVSLEKLLKDSDIITLHAPLTEQTHHMLNKKNLNLVKKTSILINTARGGLIDNSVLADFLKSKKIAFAGLDVFEGEKAGMDLHIIKNLLELDNVVITPHNASNTKEAKQRMFNTTVENILAFINNKPINVVG